MKPKKSQTLLFFLNTILIICLIILLIILTYLLYMNFPGDAENLNINLKNNFLETRTENISAVLEGPKSTQFYSNMKFNHNKISYLIDSDCDDNKKARVLNAFNEISTLVKNISFYQSLNKPDITISCSEESEVTTQEDYFVAGEGGAREIIPTGRYNIINNGTIFLYDDSNKKAKCNWPNIELHELMHVFGFGHSTNQESLMYPYLDSCDQKLDDSIVQELKRLYSEENLPDLYFEDLKVIKKGRYLDFNLTIKNSGAIDATNPSFSVLDENKVVKTYELDNIKYGAGILYSISKFKLIHKNPDKISFIIDNDNFIKEIDKKNNIITIKL